MIGRTLVVGATLLLAVGCTATPIEIPMADAAAYEPVADSGFAADAREGDRDDLGGGGTPDGGPSATDDGTISGSDGTTDAGDGGGDLGSTDAGDGGAGDGGAGDGGGDLDLGSPTGDGGADGSSSDAGGALEAGLGGG